MECYLKIKHLIGILKVESDLEVSGSLRTIKLSKGGEFTLEMLVASEIVLLLLLLFSER